MSRRGLPRIAPADLRDHASEERIARIWARLEHDVRGVESAPPRRLGLAVALIAATFAAFGGGLLLGKQIWSEPRASAPPAAVASNDLPALVDVFAAGTQGRTFQLPGGGEIALAPGTTIEVEQASGGALTLRLVQGEASVDTIGGVRTAALAIVAGEARLSPSAESVLRVRHNVDDIDVNVTDGSVKLTSPAGSRELGRGEHADRVPIRPRLSVAAAPEPAPNRAAPPPRSLVEEVEIESPAVVPSAPDWRARYNAGDVAEALQSLKQQSGGVAGAIASARTAKELMDLSDLLRTKGGDASAAIGALTRVVESFPSDANAQIAAYTLGNMYDRMGEQALAAKYFERARALSPEGNLAEDSFCKRIRAEVVAGHKEEASRMAQEYVAKYPDGRCNEEVQRIISGEEAPGESGEEEPHAAPSPLPPPLPADAGVAP
jgi:hypothetical protein